MKLARLMLSVALLLSERPSGGVSISPGGGVNFSGGKLEEVRGTYYQYAPKPDITPYELALILPHFTGPYYGDGAFYVGGSLVPEQDKEIDSTFTHYHKGYPGGSRLDGNPCLMLYDFDVERLGTAMRHFAKLPRN